MGNSIRRARRRPRVTSINWRTLKWLLPRVAVERMIEARGEREELAMAWRRWLARSQTYAVHRFGETLLRQHPDWRIRP